MQFEFTFTNGTDIQNFYLQINDTLPVQKGCIIFQFCVSQSYGDKLVSPKAIASWILIKSARRVICNVYLAFFVLYVYECRKYYHGQFVFSKMLY